MAHGESPANEDERQIFARLADGIDVTDEEIDALLPPWARHLSRVHWTPVKVAQMAARFLVDGRGTSAHILDVGSGAGKFCVVGAATTGARFTGIERRQPLVGVAKGLAKALGADVARFQCGSMEELDWSEFSGVYLYNPFGEQFVGAIEAIEREDMALWSLYVHNVRAALARLYLMPTGTRVATFHGIGGPLPPGYEPLGSEICGSGVLRYYVRIDPALVQIARPPRDLFDELILDFDDEVTVKMRAAISKTEP